MIFFLFNKDPANLIDNILKYTVPLISSILAVGIAAWFAMGKFYSEQRTSRIQKVYFENSFLNQLNNLELTIQSLVSSVLQFEAAMNLAEKYLIDGSIPADKISSIFYLVNDDLLPNIIPQISKDTIIILFNQDQHIINAMNWCKNIEGDVRRFTYMVLGRVELIKNIARPLKKQDLDTVRNIINEDHFLIRGRHEIFVFLFGKLVNFYAEANFKTKNELIDYREKPEIKTVLTQMNKCYYILFMFYKKGDVYYSYARDAIGHRLKISKPHHKTDISIVEFENVSDGELIFIKDQEELANLEVINFLRECVYREYPDIKDRFKPIIQEADFFYSRGT